MLIRACDWCDYMEKLEKDTYRAEDKFLCKSCQEVWHKAEQGIEAQTGVYKETAIREFKAEFLKDKAINMFTERIEKEEVRDVPERL